MSMIFILIQMKFNVEINNDEIFKNIRKRKKERFRV
jgi:hypothetical protein